MKFQYSVIGDNTQENREWLEKVGYENMFGYEGKLIHTEGREYYCLYNEELESDYKDLVNCIGNSPLFKAVSAMRDDSDCMQWFVSYDYGEDWQLSFQEKWDCTNTDWHKATLTELQERFKEKEK